MNLKQKFARLEKTEWILRSYLHLLDSGLCAELSKKLIVVYKYQKTILAYY